MCHVSTFQYEFAPCIEGVSREQPGASGLYPAMKQKATPGSDCRPQTERFRSHEIRFPPSRFFHHKHPVSAITYTHPASCENMHLNWGIDGMSRSKQRTFPAAHNHLH